MYPGAASVKSKTFTGVEITDCEGRFADSEDAEPVGIKCSGFANGDSCDAFSNIFLDPLFADPLNGNYQITWANYPTPDSTKSPCIDAGNPSSPLDPDNTVADIGAFYFHQQPPQTTEHEILLPAGWNTKSTYILPNHPNMWDVFANIPSLVIVKNGDGEVFWPEYYINDIGDWQVTDGYQIYLTETDTLIIQGQAVSPDTTPLILHENWNLSAFLLQTPQNVETAMAPLDTNLIIVKDNNGNVYWPAYNVNTIGSMLPGEGYWIDVQHRDTLYYIQQDGGYQRSAPLLVSAEEHDYPVKTAHFVYTPWTGGNATLLIRDIYSFAEVVSEVGVFTSDNLCVGAGLWEDTPLAVAVWGDDPLTPELDGAAEGSELNIRLWLQNENITEEALPKIIESDLIYRENGLMAVELIGKNSEKLPIVTFESVNPNPFNPVMRFTYHLGVTVQVQASVYNLLGQQAAALVDEVQAPGEYEVLWNGSSHASGIYFMVFQAGDYHRSFKLLMLK